MGSVGFGEIALIAIVALLVFGPDRLPELSRNAGKLLTKAREMMRSFTDSLDNEFDEVSSPIHTLKAEYHATKDELTSAAGTVLNFDAPTDPDASDVTPTTEQSREDTSARTAHNEEPSRPPIAADPSDEAEEEE
jgi:Tat protein translocase TatB subunit